MIASERELYACGYKVHIPSLPSRPTSSKGGHTDTSTIASAAATTPRPPVDGPHDKPKNSSQLNTQIKVLGKSLAFSDDVVSTRSPHLVSYSKAKDGLKSLYQAEDLGMNSHVKQANNSTTRHYYRGEPQRHIPCHLSSPTDTGPEYQPKPKYTVKFRQNELQHQPGDDTSVTTTRANTGLYMVPTTNSIFWEDEILGKVSSSTARQIKGQASHTTLDDREISKNSRINRPNSFVQSRIFSDVFLDDKIERNPFLITPPPPDFLSECKGGARPVHQRQGDGNTIVLDNGALFDKVLQETYPLSPNKWCETEPTDVTPKVTSVKGYPKWLELPQPLQTTEDLQWQNADTANLLDGGSSSVSPQPSLTKTPSHKFKNHEFFEIIHNWCAKWHIHMQLKDIVGEGDILTDMHSLCDTTRMISITSVALLAEQEAITEDRLKNMTLTDRYSSRSKSQVSLLPQVTEKIVTELYQLLDDTAERVRVPSAIVLYCIDKQNHKSETILLSSLSGPGGGQAESWASVQCLACAGVSSAPVVEELMLHIQDQSRATKATKLLARLSSKTNLVHCLLSEKLNSSGWLERLTACQMLPMLHGGIKKDVCHKLVFLTWDDWSPEVRKAAAQALGLTGHGKMIHDEIGKRLCDDSETTRLDALKKLQSLNLMTAQLLPAYLACFTDDHTSIRIQAVVMAGTLKLTDRKVQDALESLLSDPSWKVKVHTLQAISEIGVWNDSLVKQLAWVVRFEKLAVVRAKACETIARLQLNVDTVVQTLRNLLTVEDDPEVLRKVTVTLQRLGCSVIPEDEMLETIRSKVKKLGTQETITAEVLQADRSNTTQCVIEGTSKPSLTTRDFLNNNYPRQRRSSSRNHRHLQDSPLDGLTSLHLSKTCSQTNQSPSVKSCMKSLHKNDSERKIFGRHTPSTTVVSSGHVDNEIQKSVLQRGGKEKGGRVWTPDRETIDNHLEMMKKRVAVD